MPMMLPPGEAVTVAVSPGQVTTAGPAKQAPQAPQPAPPPSPIKQELSPDLVIMPHLSEPGENPQPGS